VKAAVDWLSYVPSSPRAFLPITDVRGIEREVAFKPTKTKAVSSGCLVETAEMQKGETRKEPIPTSIERTGVCVLLESIKSLDSIMPSVLASMSQYDGKSPKSDDVGPVTVLYFIVAGSAELSEKIRSRKLPSAAIMHSLLSPTSLSKACQIVAGSAELSEKITRTKLPSAAIMIMHSLLSPSSFSKVTSGVSDRCWIC
jgi:hypothetical protein